MARVTIRQLGTLTEWTVQKHAPRQGDKRTGNDRPARAHGTHAERAESNISRAKRRIREIALCNEWDWFATLTIDPDKYNRTNLESYYKDFADWLHRRADRGLAKVRYIVVPELHADKVSYHMHALLAGVPADELGVVNGRLNWLPYYEKFGFSLLEPIEDATRCAMYMSKYITKDLGTAVQTNGQLYRASKGLARGKVLAAHDDLTDADGYADALCAFEQLPAKEWETDHVRKKTLCS